ncbi:tetratricopeptide repeat protein [Kordia algicida OT-1]|uniref:histidine kinase n=1 Tax=Kordia algicida OT-1 TaxID=391587 RepID=A9DX31_9FLAO|nr:tetratricopeptide repeat protein [Kordia algicida]EDP95954.1 two-component sensor histidine kinase [Kordia algicida OT-1]
MNLPFQAQRFLLFFAILFTAIQLTQCKKVASAENDEFRNLVDSLNTEAFSNIIDKQWETSFLVAKKSDSIATIHNYKKGIAKSLRIQAYYWNHKVKLDSAFRVLQQAERLEIATKNYVGLRAVYNTKALLYKRNELYDEALEVYQKALSIQDSSITNKQRSTTHANLGNVYVKKGVYDVAVYHLQQSLLLNKDDTTSRQTIKTYTNLGNVYSLSSDYNLAEFYYKKALKHYKNKENETEIAKLYNNLGALFYEKNEDALSLEYFKKSIQLKEKTQDSSALVEGYLNIAELYSDRNHSVAFEYLDKAENHLQTTEKASYLAKIHLSKAAMYQTKGQIAKAKNELKKAILLSKNQEKLTFERYLVKKQAEIAFQERNFKNAYNYRIAYEKLNDSVFNEEKLWEIAALQKSAQAKMKKIEVASLEKDRALAEEIALRKQKENEQLYAYLIVFGLTLCLVSVIAFYFYKLKKTTSQLAKQQELLLQERIQNLVNNQELEIINATLTARSKEKEAISKELHNNIGSLLTSVKFHFQAFDENVLKAHNGTKKLYDKTMQIINTITMEIRSISHRFDQDPIPEFNLKNAIANFSEKVQNERLKVHTAIHGLENFQNSQISIFIFRILQELVNNTLKHAVATNLTIYITKNTDHINIMVEDDGKGFDMQQHFNGIGLKNLRKQVQIIEGNYHIDSNKKRGTTVTIDIPI